LSSCAHIENPRIRTPAAMVSHSRQESVRSSPRSTGCVQEGVADLGDPGSPVALPHAAVPLLWPRHWRRRWRPCSLGSEGAAALLWLWPLRCVVCDRVGGEEWAKRFDAATGELWETLNRESFQVGPLVLQPGCLADCGPSMGWASFTSLCLLGPGQPQSMPWGKKGVLWGAKIFAAIEPASSCSLQINTPSHNTYVLLEFIMRIRCYLLGRKNYN
jgi:hypothetical protein